MKLLRVHIEGWTATFRLPLLYSGTGLMVAGHQQSAKQACTETLRHLNAARLKKPA